MREERSKVNARRKPVSSHTRALVRTWSQARLNISLPVACDMSLEIDAEPSLWHKLLIDALPTLREAQTKVLHTRASTVPANTRGDDGGKVPRRSHNRPRGEGTFSIMVVVRGLNGRCGEACCDKTNSVLLLRDDAASAKATDRMTAKSAKRTFEARDCRYFSREG
ncbi:hypothetical protein RUE5091_00254 [Ruegeria denitrificans]|uniref:Uncharacterized protein n=1 Tax=Ruegeria denitrificans TaxID=1715692 RepID=A0A0P1I1L9_9RHOB|nr:hypothetical protein RUE5091_00254 [Ruegeria denitrificans]